MIKYRYFHIFTVLWLAAIYITAQWTSYAAENLKATRSNNRIQAVSTIRDTLIATVIVSTTPPLDFNGNTITNGDFEIEVSGSNPITGDGVDEETHWLFPITFPHDDPSLMIVSALLTMHITPMDPSANNDGVWIRGCNCGQIDVGSHNLFQQYTFQTEMVGAFSAQSILNNIRTNGGLRLGYQDDAIVSFAELRLIIVSPSISSLNVISPYADEVMVAGTQYDIIWASQEIDQVRIEFSNDGGVNYTTVATNVPADSNRYNWNVPQALSTNCKIKLTDVNNDSIFSVSGTFTITELSITNPQTGELWIAGEQDTIRWNAPGIDSIKISFCNNYENGTGVFNSILEKYPANSGYYIWNIPDTILSSKCAIGIEDASNINVFGYSEVFKIKGYVLTKYLPDGNYKPYSMFSDRWGFGNDTSGVWNSNWYSRFNYTGIDPFTGGTYSSWQGGFVFYFANSSDHPDWPSFVKTFGVNACYINTFQGVYSPTALTYWASKKSSWAGSCFGIAISNFLAWENKISFRNRYPNFPNFINASLVASDTNTIPVINELFTHQFGNPHRDYRSNIALNKTPNQTLADLKQMFITDGAQLQTLSFLNNPPGTGGHAILAYKVEKDTVTPNIFYVYVYDNSYPDSLNARIVFNTTANGGNGLWSFNHWPGWGGNKWIYLRDAVSNYLTNPTLNKGTGQQSPFILSDDLLRVNTGINASIRIQDANRNTTGYSNGDIQLDIPNSYPLITDNGSETPPYGYELPVNNYSIILDHFTQDRINAYFFNGNKTFSYERSSVSQAQTDRLFFDGGVSVSNQDQETKIVSLLNIINETTQEKVFALKSVELVQNDSVKIENPDDDKLKLISYGSAKNYDIELNFASENKLSRFENFNISLSANTSHTFLPKWQDINNNELVVLVDIGNDGTIEDTLNIENYVTDNKNEGSLRIPQKYNLAQNFPNPFNPVTTIKYSIPKSSIVTLKVYDILGREAAVLVNEEKPAGNYEVTFNAANLPSGIYFYRIQVYPAVSGAGNFIDTKKMLLLK
jgi:hypothetical protein